MQIEHLTNRPSLWEELHAQHNRKDFCLYDLGHQSSGSMPMAQFEHTDAWNTAKHIFLLDKEAHPQMLDTLQKDSRVHVWDSLVLPDQARWHPYFWWWDSCVTLSSYHGLHEDLKDPIQHSPEHVFEFIVGRTRVQRKWLLDRLDQHPEVRNLCLINVHGQDPYLPATDRSWDGVIPGQTVYDQTVNLWGQSKLPLTLALPSAIYNRTWFSLITESRSDHTRFFSEKTAKPLLGRRLFVLFAAPGMLKDLQNLGFKTFHDILDETYDSIQDDEERWSRALDQVAWISAQDPQEIYQKALPVLLHNQQLMLATNWEKRMLNQMHYILSKS